MDTNELFKALLQAKKEIGAIEKTEENPFFNSNYFDINKIIEEVEPVLLAHGLIVLQPLTELNGKPAIKTILIHTESGQSIESVTPLIENSDPQKLGSCVTYFRRYSLVSLLCLRAEDDDANLASKPSKAMQVPPKTENVATGQTEAKDYTLKEGDPCPECGVASMKLRKGPKGPFLGCGAYPNCKNTAQI